MHRSNREVSSNCFSKYRSLCAGENPNTWKEVEMLKWCEVDTSVQEPGLLVSRTVLESVWLGGREAQSTEGTMDG